MGSKSCELFCMIKKRLLGDLLLTGSFISKQDLEIALSKQKETNKLIGELLVEIGAISKEELNLVLQFQEDLSNPERAIKFAVGLRKKLGELLLEAGKITETQLNEALKIQNETNQKIGEILISKGFITEKELKAVLLFQKTQEEKEIPKKLKLGELLVNLGIITNEQLEQALKVQSLYPEKRLGEILIELGFAKDEDIKRGLTLQQKLARIALSTLITFSSTFFVNEVVAKEVSPPSTKGKIQIIAEVKSFAKINLTKQINEFVITENTLSRKILEINNATSLDLKTNTNSIFVVFEGFGDGVIEEVEIYGFGEAVKIGPNGGMVFIKNPAKLMHFDLSYKFKINENARIGTYVWPYTISVTTY